MKKQMIIGKKVSCLFKEQIDKLELNKKPYMLSGCAPLDEMIGGYSPRELIVVGGQIAMGKTKFLLKSALELSKNQGVLYCSLELSERQLLNRILSLKMNDPKKFHEDNLTQYYVEAKDSAEEELRNYQLFLTNERFESIKDFVALCNYHVAKNQIKLIILDYMQLFPKGEKEKEIVDVLIRLAEELNIILIVASQLSKKIEKRGGDKKPILSDLHYHVSLQNRADKVLMLYRPEFYGFIQDENGNSNARKLEVLIVKNENGALGSIVVDF